ncbi:unnamed protein product [Sphagnum troendelagicum]|uniref:Uncharacterized protein n=1 Tax=Sphagnum troendelagicum TaxID=128251 RepID=A0ABP0T868_9BRYO
MGRLTDGVNDMKGITMGPLPAESQQHMLRKNAPLGLSVELFKTAMKQLFLTQQKWLYLLNNLFSSLRAAVALIAKYG